MIYTAKKLIAGKEATVGKKEKKVWALHEEFQAMITLVPKLEELLSIHKEMSEGYQKYRKNGGDAIPCLEKHLGIKESGKTTPVKAEKVKSTKDSKESKEVDLSKKSKKGKGKPNPKVADPMHDEGAA